MKYRLLCLLLCLLLLCACAQPEVLTDEAEFSYYYPAASLSVRENGVICSAQAPQEATQFSLRELVTDYLSSPVPDNSRSVTPGSWRLQSVLMRNTTAVIVFSGTSTTPLECSLSCACLAKTLLQLDGIRRISVSVPGQRDPVVLTENDILLLDTGMLPQEELVVLYYPDTELRYLVAQTQGVPAMGAAEKPAFIVQQLLQSGKNACIAPGTELLDIRVENGVCTVNLSSAFGETLPESFAAERMAVYSIVNSLTELPEITTVDLWVSGAPLEKLGQMDISAGVLRDERLIFTPVGRDTADVTLYPLSTDDGLLPAIPMMPEMKEEQSLAAAVIDALFSYSEMNGLHRCIPEGTKVLSLRIEETNCVIDLTGEFLSGCENGQAQQLAVRSIVATLCALPEIDTVELLVEGITPDYQNSGLRLVHQSDPNWFAP